MQLEGVIVEGRVELDSPAELPDGTRVRVEPVAAEPPALTTPAAPSSERQLTSLNKFLLSISGTAPNLPPDMAENHNHYCHGAPKR